MALSGCVWRMSLVLAALESQAPLTHAGTLRKVWEIDLSKAVRRSDGSPDFPVFAMRFSPDGRKLAVIADVYRTQGGRKSRLLVSSVDHPSSNIPQFEI